MMLKDFSKSSDVHTTLKSEDFLWIHLNLVERWCCYITEIFTCHSVHMKETYINTDLLLEAISYSKYGWKICGDLKVIGLLLGMQSGYTEFCCVLCEWDSQAGDKHYTPKDWLM